MISAAGLKGDSKKKKEKMQDYFEMRKKRLLWLERSDYDENTPKRYLKIRGLDLLRKVNQRKNVKFEDVE